MRYLSLCAIAKEEKRYIDEWLIYHYGIGIEHVYIYDNSSNNELNYLINTYGTKKITIIPFTLPVGQRAAYTHCFTNYKKDTTWLAFIDIDEFIVPRKHTDLKEFLKPYEKYAAVCPHWYLFGSNGHQVYENKPVVERFTKREAEVNTHVKSIINPRRTFKYHTPHKFTHTSYAVDEHEHPIGDLDSRPTPATADLIQINHYAIKSIEECKERRKHPRADNGQIREINNFLALHDKNEVEDLRALELWNLIKGNK